MALTQASLSSRVGGRADPALVGLTVALVVAGVIVVFDTTYFRSQASFANGFAMLGRHLSSIAMGSVLLGFLARRRSRTIQRWSLPAYGAATFMLLLTHVPGVSHCANGACRWVNLGPLNFQPSEFAKLAFVALAASILTRAGTQVREWNKGIVPVLGLMAFYQAILVTQPDFGTVVLLGALAFALMYLGGVPFWRLAIFFPPLALLGALAIKFEPYRLRRFLCFLDPWDAPQGACYQLVQSFRTFASGGYTGLGLGSSMQKSGWLPEAHTDFVFAVIGEEIGIAGAVFVLLLFVVFVYRGLRIAYRHPETYGQLLAAGLTLSLAIQVLINMGVVLGLLPTKGLALPFLSYGNSSMLATLATVGLLMALSREVRER